MADETQNDRTLNVGLLLCDDVDEAAQARYGSYAEMFGDGISAVDSRVRLHAVRCYQGELPAAPGEFDGFMISGSRRSVYEDVEWITQLQDFVRRCRRERVRTVGICFGHQLIAQALGGEVRLSDAGWGLGMHRTVIRQPQAWMAPAPDAVRLVAMHRDQVMALPAELCAVAGDEFCAVSMFADDAGTVFGIQGHPEFTAEFCRYRVDARKAEHDPAVYQRAIDSLDEPASDSAVVLRWVVRFLRG